MNLKTPEKMWGTLMGWPIKSDGFIVTEKPYAYSSLFIGCCLLNRSLFFLLRGRKSALIHSANQHLSFHPLSMRFPITSSPFLYDSWLGFSSLSPPPPPLSFCNTSRFRSLPFLFHLLLLFFFLFPPLPLNAPLLPCFSSSSSSSFSSSSPFSIFSSSSNFAWLRNLFWPAGFFVYFLIWKIQFV